MITILHCKAGLVRILYKSSTPNQKEILVTTSQGRRYKHRTVNAINGSYFQVVVNPGESIKVSYPDEYTLAWRQESEFSNYATISMEDVVTIGAEHFTVSVPHTHSVGLQGPKNAGVSIQASKDTYVQVSSTAKLKTNLNNTDIEALNILLYLRAFQQIVLTTTEASNIILSRFQPQG